MGQQDSVKNYDNIRQIQTKCLGKMEVNAKEASQNYRVKHDNSTVQDMMTALQEGLKLF